MRNASLAVAALCFLVLGCDASTTTTPTADGPAFGAGGNPIVHQASMGGNDFCLEFDLPNGCDKNFSLIAQELADGTDRGQWVDQFSPEFDGGIHVDVDCLNVIGNEAWIGGIVTKGSVLGTDLTGERVLTRVADNGTSANDPPDQISFSGPAPVGIDCNNAPDLIEEFFPLLDMTGQVKVR